MKVKANGIEMHYTLEGPVNAPVVTLSHSLATDVSMWEPQLAALRARYRVLSYDTRGHVLTRTDGVGHTTSYGYDTNGNVSADQFDRLSSVRLR